MLSEQENDNLLQFLRDYCQDEIAQLCKQWPREKESLEIDYLDLFRADIYEQEDISDVLTTDPMRVIKDLRHAAESYDYPVDMDIEPEIRILGSEFERTVEELRQDDVGKYITVKGQVNELTQVEPKPVNAVFRCKNCSTPQEILQDRKTFLTPASDCEACDRGYMGWELDDKATTYQDHQIIELAALPEDTAGGAPEKIKVEVTDGLTGQVSAGDRIEVSGIVKTEKEDLHTKQNPSARRPIYLDGWAIKSEQESFQEIEPTRIEEIKQLPKNGDVFNKLINSFAPHIHTDEHGDMQKLAILLSLFGGVQKQLDTGSQIRGNINVLLVGDGGTAKSQFLKTAEKLAPKSVIASGKGATAAGLTATAEQSNLTGEWSLKAGALVMANNGVACIDEFDKMTADARKSIHEALENQEVPVTKAGINTTLPAKTAVIAAANPENGEFDRFGDLIDEVDMEQPLISRFDIIFGLEDEQDTERDTTIAETQYRVSAGDLDVEPEIQYDLLREYIAYARRIEPEFASDDVMKELVDYYVKLREKAEDGDEPGPRLNDSLRRFAQASARVRLSPEIETEDAERAINMLKFHIGQVGLDEHGNISGTQINGGTTSQQKRIESVEDAIRRLDQDEAAMIDEIYDRVDIPEHKVDHEIEKLKQKGEVYEPITDGYRLT